MNIRDRARLYAEISRVLKPGGRLGIHDIVRGNGEPLVFPVPWARTPEISFLLSGEEMRAALLGSGFSVVSWIDSTDATIAWLNARPPAPPSRFGLGTVMGPDFSELAANLERNLREGRARVVQTVVRRDEPRAETVTTAG